MATKKFRFICEIEVDAEPKRYTDEETGETYIMGPIDPKDRAWYEFCDNAEDYIVKIEEVK